MFLDSRHFYRIKKKLNGLGIWEATHFGAQAALSWHLLSLMTTRSVSAYRLSGLQCEKDVMWTGAYGEGRAGKGGALLPRIGDRLLLIVSLRNCFLSLTPLIIRTT